MRRTHRFPQRLIQWFSPHRSDYNSHLVNHISCNHHRNFEGDSYVDK
jgi:hypothetical protein